ncbi:MAG: rRNA pseudouridine synthase [Marinilabiliaceae bacterium]|nr:rRNA pseudouridine synthase [Marinilabiliaceae bacterium]
MGYRENREKRDFSRTNKSSNNQADNKTASNSGKKNIQTSDIRKRNGLTKHERIEKEGIRLNKFIANAGVCSRREADKLIQEGQITVNGKVITEMGVTVNKSDEIIYNGKRLSSELLVYVLLNKPKDVVTTLKDPHAKLTVMDIVHNACDERIYPVGRLDKNTTGVLLLTNDGDLSKKLTHPKYNVKKIYHVFLDKQVTKKHLDDIQTGITLDDGTIKADAISYVEGRKNEIGIEIHSGRNRIVRRIFEHLGYRVEKLDRVYFAGLTKKALPRGRWRYLTDKEIKLLKAGLLT